MNNKIQQVFINGLPFGIMFFIVSFAMGLVYLDLQKAFQISFIAGVLGLFVYGLVFNRFSKPTADLELLPFTMGSLEMVVMESAANHLVGSNLFPGKLVLTNERLIFKFYSDGDDDELEYSWKLSDISPKSFHRAMLNSGGEFLLTLGEDTLMFEVSNLKHWKTMLLQLLHYQ